MSYKKRLFRWTYTKKASPPALLEHLAVLKKTIQGNIWICCLLDPCLWHYNMCNVGGQTIMEEHIATRKINEYM